MGFLSSFPVCNSYHKNYSIALLLDHEHEVLVYVTDLFVTHSVL